MTKKGSLATLLRAKSNEIKRKSGGGKRPAKPKVSNNHNSNHFDDIENLLNGGSDAYASLVAGLSSRSDALKRRRLEEEGMDEESEEEEVEEEEDKGRTAMHETQTRRPRAIDSWSREGIKTTILNLNDKDESKRPPASEQEDASAAGAKEAITDTWSVHFERELGDNALPDSDQGPNKPQAGKILSPSDCPPIYKTAFPGVSWQVSQGLSSSSSSSSESLLPDPPASLSAFGVKERLRSRWLEVQQEDAKKMNEPSSSDSQTNRPHGDFSSARQRVLFSALNSYSDLIFPCRPYPQGDPSVSPLTDEVMDAYLLHALNHVVKTGDRIKKNNDQIEAASAKVAKEAAEAGKARGESEKIEGVKRGKGKKESHHPTPTPNRHLSLDSLPRDQGFTRPKVLILLPQRNLAFHTVRRLVALAMRETRSDSVHGKEKFVEQFTVDEDEDGEMDEKARARRALKPPDWQGLFSGNLDDHFRMGIRVNKGSIKLFADLFQSDIIIASPIAIATKLAEAGKGKPGGPGGKKSLGTEADFLSSIEILIVDRADVLSMQNWSHVNEVMEALNLLPREQHGGDIMRVREYYLGGVGRYLRQTVILSSFLSPDINRTVAEHCNNIVGGRIRAVPEYQGVLSAVVPQARQIFERFPCTSPSEAADARFEHFKSKVWPRMRESGNNGQLIFISRYFDYVRVRNLLNSEAGAGDLFSPLCEYTSSKDAIASRSRFFHMHRRILLYTERAHFYNRHRIRGIKDILFYSLPDHAEFYSEVLNLLETDAKPGQSSGIGSHATISTLYCKLDLMQLERVVGTSRARKMVAGETTTFMFC